MARGHIYTVYQDSPTEFRCVKMEKDFEPIETYQISRTGEYLHCTCYASNKSVCRHRTMVTLFAEKNLLNSRAAYEFDKQRFVHMPNAEQ